MASKVKSQIGMDDVVVRNSEIEVLLEERQGLKEELVSYYTIDKKAKAELVKLETKPPFRIGRFIITIVERQPRSVSFEAAGSSSLKIQTADE